MQIDPANVTYILSNNTLIPFTGSGNVVWRRRIFAFLLAQRRWRPTQFFTSR